MLLGCEALFDVGTVGLRGDRPPLVGSRCRTYLLEKSRVVQQAPGERTYHCFYGVARGENDPSGCAPDLAALRYTRESDLDTGSIEGVPDGDRHAKTWDALALVGVEDGDRAALARCLGAILVLGDVDFEATDAADDDCGSSRATAGPGERGGAGRARQRCRGKKTTCSRVSCAHLGKESWQQLDIVNVIVGLGKHGGAHAHQRREGGVRRQSAAAHAELVQCARAARAAICQKGRGGRRHGSWRVAQRKRARAPRRGA